MKKTGPTVCAAAMVALLCGCEKKVGGQVVAIVDGQEITRQELNAELGGQSIPQSADRRAVMTRLLQRVIDRKLLVGEAKEQGLDKSPAYLAQVQRAQDAVLIDMLANNVAKTIPIPDRAAATRFMEKNASLFAGRKRYQLDQLVFQAVGGAGLEARLKSAKTLTDVEAVLKGASIPFQRRNARLDTATVAPALAARIAALSPGEPFLVPQYGQVAASVVRGIEEWPVPLRQAQPAAVELLRRQGVEQAIRRQADQARAGAEIIYAPDLSPGTGTAPSL